MTDKPGSRVHERWARLRFAVIGQLLASPPEKGALRAALEELADREWRHPTTGAPVRFGVSTLERWFYRARNERQDPVGVLRCKRRQDAGEQASMTTALRQALLAQYDAHQGWSAKLHHDNLVALAETRAGAAAGAILHDGAAIPASARPDQAASTDDASDRRWRWRQRPGSMRAATRLIT